MPTATKEKPPAAVATGAGNGGAPKDEGQVFTSPLDSTELTWIAEGAHGMQDVDMALVEAGSGKFKLKTLKAATADGDKVVLHIKTKSRNPNAKKPYQVVVKATKESKEIELQEECDALFWTPSALEKFLFPYYQTHRMFKDSGMERLKKEIYDEKVIAVAHIPPSHTLVKDGVDLGESFIVYSAGPNGIQRTSVRSLIGEK